VSTLSMVYFVDIYDAHYGKDKVDNVFFNLRCLGVFEVHIPHDEKDLGGYGVPIFLSFNYYFPSFFTKH